MRNINRQERVVLNGLLSKYGKETLLEAINYKAALPYATAAALAASGGILANKIDNAAKNRYIQPVETDINTLSNPYNMNTVDYELFKEKVDSAKAEINRVLGYHGKSIDDLEFDLENAIYLCYKYNFDLPLMLAQMQCESHFGTTDRAKRTGSVISIGQWDNKTVKTYDSQDECIEPYIKIMQRDYLQNGKVSVDNLLKPGNFVNYMGKRYASNKNYENSVRSVRDNLIKKYPALAKNYSTYNI